MRWLLAPATITALLLAIASRFAAHVWLQDHPFDPPTTALIAAAVIAPACLYLGWRKGRTLAGAIGGVTIGVVAAAAFFLAAPLAGEQAVWVAWLCGWLLLSALQSFLEGHLQLAGALVRGTLAAAVGAIGFAFIVTFPLSMNFAAWTVAFLPALHVLFRR